MLNVAVVDNLPADIILGRDMPILTDLLIPDMNIEHDVNQDVENYVCMMVVTRAQAKVAVQPLPDFDNSLLQSGTKGPRKTHHQRCLIKYMGTPVSKS